MSQIPELQFERFFAYDELTAYVRALASARPELCQLSSLGSSRQGRDIHLLTITDLSSG
ncbi:MAG: M14 family zinc carboxypeptidase, partial [Anaerolineae bacterium]